MPATAAPTNAAEAARFLNRYARDYSAGAFATPTAKEMASWWPAGDDRCWHWWDAPDGGGVAAVSQRLTRDSFRRDFTGRRIHLPTGSHVITHIARTPDAPIPDLSGWDYINSYVEDTALTTGLRTQGRELVGVRISAASEIIGCWGMPGTGYRYSAADTATIARLPLDVPQHTRARILDEVAAVDQWHDDFPYYCVTPDTEILTRDGWRTYDQVGPGDQVLTLNHETGTSEWQPLQAVNVFPAARHRMLQLDGNKHRSLTTLDHRWPVISRRYPRSGPPTTTRRFRTSRELGRLDLIPTAAPCTDLPEQAKYSDAFVELVAWFWTEGYVRADGGCKITQSTRVNPGHAARIRAALAQVFGPARDLRRGPRSEPGWSDKADGDMAVFWLNKPATAHLTAVAPDKVVTNQFVLSLTRAQLDLFLKTSVDADGTPTAKGSPLIYQNCRERLEPIALAVVLSGRTPALYLDKSSGIWSLTLMERTTVNPIDAASRPGDRRATAGLVDYEGIVWCPTTPNGTWLARRNGTVFYTGNSNGAWSAVSLRGFNPTDPRWGVKPSEMSKAWWREHPDAAAWDRCDWTVLADRCPQLVQLTHHVTAGWGGELERVRLLRMEGRAGKVGRLARHSDITDRAAGTADGQIIRLHLPIVTHPDITMTGWDLTGGAHTVHLPAWTLWYLDARKPHAVSNPTTVNRVHLVIDVTATPAARAALAAATDYAAPQEQAA